MPRPIRPLLVAALAAAAVLTARAQSLDATPVRFTANAINMNAGAAGVVEIVIDRWSSNAERDKLMSVMLDKGPEKLLDALQDMPRVGYFRTPGSLGLDIHFARHTPGKDGGQRVVIVTDRRIAFWEAANQTRSAEYPFTVIELRLNNDGEGEGKLSIATKIIADKENNIITLENYDIQPVMLTNVRVERASR
jgi:hypothetical protein